MRVLLLILALLPSLALAGFPKNDLDKEDCIFCFNSTMDEAKFNEIIDSVVTMYAPIIADHGGTFSVNRLWTDSTVNASAQQMGDSWVLNMYGGLARRPEITADGFALVVCHELGHHLGGFPYYPGDNYWAANEGQADYFSTHVCAKKIWSDATKRVPLAAQSLANLLSKLESSRQPSPSTPDKSKVGVTYDGHPAAQCRLDTYLAGFACAVPFIDSVIPGKNHPDGQQSLGAQQEAMKYSCVQGKGSRPLCWFAPVQ